MNDSQFWLYIDQALSSESFVDDLKKTLRALGSSEIISFKNILLQKLVDAYVPSLLAANFVISSYVSDDGFKEFRAWLISKGEVAFQNAIKNPETIADWLDKEEVDDIEGEDFLFLADELYAELEGYENDFYQKIYFPSDPDITMIWPDNKAEYKRQYPNLVEKFWNQQRINEMHSD